MTRVAVVGAGIAGLACANDLRRAGIEVLVFEKEATVGGRMNTRVKDGLSFDFGASFLVDAYATLHGLARQVGVRVDDFGHVEHVFRRDGRWCHLNFSSLRDVFRMEGLTAATRAKLLWFLAMVLWKYPEADFFDLDRLPDELLEDDAYDYASRLISREFADYVVDAFCTTMMFHRSTEICNGALVALMSMMADPHLSFGVQHARGEMSAIPRAIASGLDVRLAEPVKAVRPASGGRLEVQTGPGPAFFDAVVMATTADAALAALRAPSPEQAAVLAGTRYSRTINVSFRIPAELLGGRHCFYVPYIESRVVSEFTNEAVKGESTRCGGHSLVNAGLHEAAAAELLGAPDGDVFAAVGAELRRLSGELHAARDRMLPHDLERWPRALPKYDSDHVRRVRRLWSQGQGAGGVYLCGDYMNTPWLEGAAVCGQRVASLVIERLAGRGQTISPVSAV